MLTIDSTNPQLLEASIISFLKSSKINHNTVSKTCLPLINKTSASLVAHSLTQYLCMFVYTELVSFTVKLPEFHVVSGFHRKYLQGSMQTGSTLFNLGLQST